MNGHYILMDRKSDKELQAMAIRHKIFDWQSLSRDQLIRALHYPKRYNETSVRKFISNKFGVSLKQFQIGNYIKWHSPWVNHSCTGRYEGIRPDGRIIVSWMWQNKWVKGTVDPRNVIDLKNVRYHGYGS